MAMIPRIVGGRSMYTLRRGLPVVGWSVVPRSITSHTSTIRRRHRDGDYVALPWSNRQYRSFSINSSDAVTKKNNGEPASPNIVYEGPFASLTLRLKRISLMSAVVGVVGLPVLSFSFGSSVPASGQLAVVVTAGITAVGSTALLGYCFSPYVHTLERLVGEENGLIRITTRDILARKVETVFDPKTDVSLPPKQNSRPFCNFVVNGAPMFVHQELVRDNELRVQLLGENAIKSNADTRHKTDDDEFL